MGFAALTSIAAACDAGHNTVLVGAAQRDVDNATKTREFAAFANDIKKAEEQLWNSRAALVLSEKIPPPQRASLGNVIIAAMTPGRASFGGRADIAWHRYSFELKEPYGGW